MVSVLLPAYNEGDVIDIAIRKVDEVLRGTGFNYEIIVVDDGSVDDTHAKALAYARLNNHVKVVGHKVNLGKGAAIKTGFAHSRGDFVVLMDSDLEIDPEYLRIYILALRFADIAIGSKWHPKSEVEVPMIRRFLSKAFHALARLLVGIRVSDTQVGLKAFRREAMEKLLCVQLVKRYAFDVELLAIASLLKLKVVELPVRMKLRAGFRLSEIVRMFLDLLGIAYRLRVLKWYQDLFARKKCG